MRNRVENEAKARSKGAVHPNGNISIVQGVMTNIHTISLSLFLPFFLFPPSRFSSCSTGYILCFFPFIDYISFAYLPFLAPVPFLSFFSFIFFAPLFVYVTFF